MITTKNEVCIGKLHENCYLMGEGMMSLIVEYVNFTKEEFSGGKMSTFLAIGWDFSSISRISHKRIREVGTVHT